MQRCGDPMNQWILIKRCRSVASWTHQEQKIASKYSICGWDYMVFQLHTQAWAAEDDRIMKELKDQMKVHCLSFKHLTSDSLTE